jgi:hypothetical protein
VNLNPIYTPEDAPLSPLTRARADFRDTVGEVHQVQPAPAEACTDIGADTAPVHRLGLFKLIRLAFLRWHLRCLRDERDHYTALGMTGAVYMRNSLQEDLRLRRAIRELEQS